MGEGSEGDADEPSCMGGQFHLLLGVHYHPQEGMIIVIFIICMRVTCCHVVGLGLVNSEKKHVGFIGLSIQELIWEIDVRDMKDHHPCICAISSSCLYILRYRMSSSRGRVDGALLQD